MCKQLRVSTSGYYAWRHKRQLPDGMDADAILAAQIKGVHAASHGAYGSPRIHQALHQSGICVGRKRVARLMHEHGLCDRTRRRAPQTTVRDEHAAVAPKFVRL